MGKIKTLILTLCIFFFSITTVSAACTAEETNRLNSLAVNVKPSFEIITKEIPAEDNFNTPDGLTEEEIENYKYYRDYFKIYISNVTEDLYVKVTNKRTNEVNTFYYKDVIDGVIVFEKKVYYEINNYVIEVYSSTKTNCPNKKLYTLYIATPMYNSLSESSLCEGIEEFYMCHKYLSVDISFDNYEMKINEYQKGKIDKNGNEIDDNNKKDDKLLQENNWVVLSISAGVLLIMVSATVIIVKKRRSKKI